MSRFIIMTRYAVERATVVSHNPNHEFHPGSIWLWDDEYPRYRIFLSGTSNAYVPGDLVNSLRESWGPEEAEVAFKESAT